jgi:hypothetical protein
MKHMADNDVGKPKDCHTFPSSRALIDIDNKDEAAGDDEELANELLFRMRVATMEQSGI